MAITNTPHAALLCPPGMGHIIPALELAKRLVTHDIIPKVTFFLASIKNSGVSQAETKVLQSTMKSKLFDIIQLPPIDISSLLGPDANMGTKLAVILKQSMPPLSQAITTMTPQPTILITELFGSLVLPIAEKLKMSKYVFLPSNAWSVALSLHTPTLDKVVQGEYIDQTKPIPIPGCNPINPGDLFSPLLDRTNQLYHEYLHMCEELRRVDGILVNTFHELEAKTLVALRSGQISKVPVYPIGPLIRGTREDCDEKKSYAVDWLDKQEEESVIYVSLGSGYTMSHEQIKEMALGLELSGKKFVWSLRPPATNAGNDCYLTAGEDAETNKKGDSVHEAPTWRDLEKVNVRSLTPISRNVETNGAPKTQPSSAFPDEFYKIQNKGLMVMDWAPQLDILKHSSVGGFVSHCGWNSVLESVSCGVPIVGWPLFAEQMMNAEMLAEEVGIGIKLNVTQSTKVVGREDIAKAIRKIMDKEDTDGSAMRKRVKELRHIAESAWSQDGRAFCEMASAFVKTSHSNGV